MKHYKRAITTVGKHKTSVCTQCHSFYLEDHKWHKGSYVFTQLVNFDCGVAQEDKRKEDELLLAEQWLE